MLGLMVQSGFRTVADLAEADVAVDNTCAFLGSAVRESRDTIARVAELKARGLLRGLIVTGCLAHQEGGRLLEDFPQVDALLGTGQSGQVARAAAHVLGGGGERIVRAQDPGGS